MNISHFAKLFAGGFTFFLCADMLWIGFIMRKTYQSYLGPLMRTTNGALQVNWSAGIAVWALIVLGAIIFALPRAYAASYAITFAWGALYGLVLYGVYDLTNYALLANWPLAMTFIDICWGICVNGLLLVVIKWLDNIIR